MTAYVGNWHSRFSKSKIGIWSSSFVYESFDMLGQEDILYKVRKCLLFAMCHTRKKTFVVSPSDNGHLGSKVSRFFL